MKVSGYIKIDELIEVLEEYKDIYGGETIVCFATNNEGKLDKIYDIIVEMDAYEYRDLNIILDK